MSINYSAPVLRIYRENSYEVV